MPTVDTERLTGILDYYSQQSVYTFTTGIDLDQSFTLTGATIAVQGRDYGYDPFGTSARPVSARKVVWHFKHRFGAHETGDTVKDALTLAFGHGRPVWLQKARADGTLLIAEAVSDGIPDKITPDAHFIADFSIAFEQRGDWMTQAVNSSRYDTGLKYDAGLKYDSLGLSFALTGAITAFDLTNGGTANEREAFLRFNGAMTGPITLSNQSCDVRGIPFGVGPPGQPMYITLYVNLASGEYVTIDCRTGVVATNQVGTVPWAQVVKAAGQKYYWELPPGLSHCQLQKNDGAAAGSFYILSRDRWR